MLHGVHGPSHQPDGDEGPSPEHPRNPEAEPRYCPSDGCPSHAEPDPAVPPAGSGESAAAVCQRPHLPLRQRLR